MKKTGFSLKNVGGFLLILVILFFLFKIFSGSREGFACGKDQYCVCPDNPTETNTCINNKNNTCTCKCVSGNTGTYTC
jgi:hypothetical protein